MHSCIQVPTLASISALFSKVRSDNSDIGDSHTANDKIPTIPQEILNGALVAEGMHNLSIINQRVTRLPAIYQQHI